MDIAGLTENFKNKQMKIFSNITKIGNVRNEVFAKVDSFANTLKLLHDNVTDSNTKLEDDMTQLK